MKTNLQIKLFKIKFFIFFLLFGFIANAQILKVEIIGGAEVTTGSTVPITAGNSLNFRMTNIETGNCKNLEIEAVNINNTTDFVITPNNRKDKLKPASCNGDHDKDFRIENINSSCATVSTLVTIEIKGQSDFTFTLQVNSSPIINVLGGSPQADIISGSTTTSDVNGTYFGVVEEGASLTRNYVIVNTGSCLLDITGLSSTIVNGSGFSVVPVILVPPAYNLATAQPPTVSIAPGEYAVILVTFTGPSLGLGTQEATINIANSDNTTFSFNVSAEMFNYAIPGPGGVTGDFRLWLKANRGVTLDTGLKISEWKDLGTNLKTATQPTPANQPTYLDNATSNINFNPVIDFENGVGVEQFMFNSAALSGFYSADIFIVMVPDLSMGSLSPPMTILAGEDSGDPGDITGVGFGNYSTAFSDEVLSYNQDIPGPGTFNGTAEISTSKSYANVGIINVTNNAGATAQEILYNSNLLTTTKVTNSFSNINGSKYWIGKNNGETANLNGRVAEIFTFETKLDAPSRQKVESYLAIKYGITLGSSTEAQKDYVNSFNTEVWDISANNGYNFDVAGIGRDDESDLNQKQSRTVNTTDEVTIGLGGIFGKNNANPNEFIADGDFLVWGNNQQPFSGTATNSIAIGASSPTTITRMDREWKIVETIQSGSGGDVDRVYVSIPLTSFNSFTKDTDEEYTLIVADDAAFGDANIIDVIPLFLDGAGNLQVWYNFDGIKYFTFGKASKLVESHAVTIETGDYLLGESVINLNVVDFTISAWVKADASLSNYRNVMSKGEKLQMRLNSSQQVEILIDDPTPKFTSTMALTDDKWHQITFVYDDGTVFLYIDGVLDKSAQNVVAPSPNFNNFCIGALYVDNDNVSNYFLGDIDEVYIWDQKLTEVQVHYLMNQQAEQVSGNVSGEIIPYATSSNEVASIPWGNLKVYYDFNSFYGSTVEGQASVRYFMRMNYFEKDKSILSNQTAPLPYVSTDDGSWDVEATWQNSTDQMLPNAISLDGFTVIGWNIAKISHEITSGDNNISLVGLVVESTGKLTIADPVDAQDETNSGQGLVISNYLELDGVIDLVGESQLLQSEGSIIDTDSGGYIERDQQGTANGYNYNYWSSSVGPEGDGNSTLGTGVTAINVSYTIDGVFNDGSVSSDPQPLGYYSAPDITAAIPVPPPGSKAISTYWLYKFYGPYDDYDAWEKIDENSSLLPGEGYTMKGTSGPASIETPQNYVFIGLPNNGDIKLPLNKILGTDDVERLIGNPYPSALDAEAFILDNLSITDGGNNINGTIFNGALYFWDHFGEENTHYLKGYVGGYATYNLTGGAVAISNDSRINNNLSIGGKIPGQYIPVNQGFFVSTKLETNPNNNDPVLDIATVDGGNIEFKNSQRVYAIEDGSSSQFFKSAKTKKGVSSVKNTINKPIIRLMYDSPKGYHRQIVLGKNSNASNNFDMGYDAFMADVGEEDMYWAFDGGKFVIQGVDSFDESQEFSLGLFVQKAGMARIKVDALENIDSSLKLYIKDEVTKETFEINNESFEIYLEPGNYNNRFKLVFQSSQISQKSLSVDDVETNSKISVYYDSKISELQIVNKENINISEVRLYNILGQSIQSIKLNSSEDVTIQIIPNSGIHIVKLNTDNGVLTKKINIQ